MFLVADAHSDFLYKMVNQGADIAEPIKDQQLFLEGMKKNVCVQVFAAWMDRRKPQQYQLQALEMFDAFERMLESNPGLVRFTAENEADILSGKAVGALLSLEGGEPLSDVYMVRTFHRLGVRVATLTWNYKNRLGFPAAGRANKGLTELGRDVVLEMGRVGIAADVSHLCDACVDDVLELSRRERPPMASHSNARALRSHPRNLLDRHISAISDMGGFIGVNFYKPFLAAGEASMKDVIEHIEYIGEKGSYKCVGLGSDYDGMDSPAAGLETCAQYPELFKALLARGHSEERVADIASGNFIRYIKRFI